MNLKQFKYLLNLEPKQQKRQLALMVIEKMGLLKKAIGSENQEQKLSFLAKEMSKFKYDSPIPEIKGLSSFSILSSELLELLDIEEKLDTLIWEAERHKKIVMELRNQTIDKIQKVTTDRKGVRNYEKDKREVD